MSDDRLIDELVRADPFADVVEQHLDAHPLPVDEAEVAEVVARLQGRMRKARPVRWPWLLVPLAVAAAAAVVVLGRPVDMGTAVGEPDPASTLQVVMPVPTRVVRELTLPEVRAVGGQPLELALDTVVFTSEEDRTAVVFVREGAARVADVAVPEGHWAIVESGQAPVVFADGTRPPLDPADREAAVLQGQLEQLRWMTLSPNTLKALDGLLEAP